MSKAGKFSLAMLIATALVAGVGPGSANAEEQSIDKHPSTGRAFLGYYEGKPVILVPVSYPLEMGHRQVAIDARIKLGKVVTRWKQQRIKPDSGTYRPADERESFRTVHVFNIGAGLGKKIRKNPGRAMVRLKYSYEFSGESLKGGSVSGVRTVRGVPLARPGLCETMPMTRLNGGEMWQRFPRCGRNLTWRVGETPDKGAAWIDNRNVKYRPRKSSKGPDEVNIIGSFKGQQVASLKLQVRLKGRGSNTSVVALGDSVTAGFGYFGATGKQMSIAQLINCRPGATVFNDACSSNSYNRNSSVGSTPDYLPDFGLARNISWAAQWANQYGITDYRNYAVTGSAPSDWLPNGQFNSTLQGIEQSNPTYILMTMGANPLLSDVLFGVDNMGCALESDLFGDFRQCVLDAFAAVNLSQNLNQLYSSLVQNSTSRIIVMRYHLSVPSVALAYSAAQLEAMVELLNEVIASEAAAVSASRITVVSPPRFNVGINMEPLYPSDYSCSFLGYQVDGPSVQSTPTQDELEIDHPLSFCSGPAVGPPWIISGDTGIHPSAAGYFQMASQIPAPGS